MNTHNPSLAVDLCRGRGSVDSYANQQNKFQSKSMTFVLPHCPGLRWVEIVKGKYALTHNFRSGLRS